MRQCSSLEPRLSIPDFVSQLWRKIGCETKSGTESLGSRLPVFCHGKNGPPPQNWFPPGTNFSINKDPLELILLQNMDSLSKERRPSTYFTCKIWTTGIPTRFPMFLEITQACQFSSTQCTVVSFPPACNTQYLHTLC